MLGMKLELAKNSFFDRRAVIDAMDRAQLRALSKAGAVIRRDARSSIRPAKQASLADLSPEQRESYKASVARAKAKGRPKPKRPLASSKPGEPPRSITGLLRGKQAENLAGIVFVYDHGTRSVVIGPVKLNQNTGAPATLEFGGTTTVRRGRESRTVRIAARPYMGPALARVIAQGKIPEAFRNQIKVGR